MTKTKSDDALAGVVKEIADEQTELEKQLPLPETKQRKRVPKSKLWSRNDRQELSKLAEKFLKARNCQ